MATHTNDNSTSFNVLTDQITEQAQQLRSLWQMKPAERLAAFHRGELTREQLFAWAGRCRDEVPTINGEFAFIAASTPEACVACPVCGDDEVSLTAGAAFAKHPDHRHPYDYKNPTAVRPVCPASGLTAADAAGLDHTAVADVKDAEHALAA